MPLRPCLDCGRPTEGTRCPPHRKANDNQRYAKRGTNTERGLGADHARISRAFKEADLPCECTDCGAHDGVCGRRGTPGNPITAGHITPRVHGGGNDQGNYVPECRSCNSRKGARQPPASL